MIDGSYAATRRALKREWKLKTIPYSPSDALAFQNMLLGLGNHWSFDASGSVLYSDKGLLNSGGSASYTTSGPTPKFGAGCIEVGSAGQVYWPALTGIDGHPAGAMSYVVWFWNGSAWDGYAGSYNGAAYVLYKNGVLQSPGLPGFIQFNTSLFQLDGKNFAGSSQNSYFDDLVVLPYLARPADLAVWSNASQPFSALPKITPGGDLMAGISPNAPSTVYGSVDSITEVLANTGDGGGLYDNAQQITFALKEA